MKISRSIISKFIGLGLLILVLIALFTGLSFFLTRHIASDANRINLAGRERMLSFEIAWLLNKAIRETGDEREKTLHYLRDYELPIFEKNLSVLHDGVHQEMLRDVDLLIDKWRTTVRPLLMKTIEEVRREDSAALNEYNATIHGFVDNIDALVDRLVENNTEDIIFYGRLRLGALLVSFPVLIVIALIVRKGFVMPVLRLRDATRGVEKGDFDVSVSVANRDEIGSLAESFNKMALTIGKLFGEIKDKNRELAAQLEAAVKAKKEWQETFDHITDMVSIHDKDFNIIKANRAFAEHVGLTCEDVVNRKCYELVHETCSPVAGCPHKVTVETHLQTTHEIVDPKSLKTFKVSTFPYYSPNREFLGSVHIAKDISEEKDKEMRLIMNERLASLGQMASSIAHEINNPLAAISGCAEGIMESVSMQPYDKELLDRYLKIIMEEIARCKNITTSMLSFVRKASPERRPVNINESLSRATEVIELQGRLDKVEVRCHYREDLSPVFANEGDLRQVFLSIITNALDAMENVGTLSILTGEEEHAIFAEIGDSGPGISSEYLHRIFDPFFTTKTNRGGTGLGLSIAKKIIDDHRGDMTVVSEEGKGATFRIELPK